MSYFFASIIYKDQNLPIIKSALSFCKIGNPKIELILLKSFSFFILLIKSLYIFDLLAILLLKALLNISDKIFIWDSVKDSKLIFLAQSSNNSFESLYFCNASINTILSLQYFK